jgi:hypothetical protein
VREILARLRVPVAGLVLIGAHETPGTAGYYYGYQSHRSAAPSRRRRGVLRRSRRAEPALEPASAPRPATPPVDVERPRVEPAPAMTASGPSDGAQSDPWAWP